MGILGEQWVQGLEVDIPDKQGLLEVGIPDMQGVQGLLGIHPLPSPSSCSALRSSIWLCNESTLQYSV